MKILVTGGAGFIGSHIVDQLIEKGHTVVILDNLVTGKKENINPQAKFIQKDLANYSDVEKVFEEENPEVVYHLAAQIDVRKSVADPVFDAQINILGSLNLIRLAHKFQVKKIIFSSTGGAIYGETSNRPTPEGEPEFPLSPYGIGKLTTEKYLNFYHKVFGLNYTILRYANVYGPRQNAYGEAGVVAIFMQKMKEGFAPVINGEGYQTRDYVYVGDVVRANILALEAMEKVGTYNIGTGVETSVNELFGAINTLFEGRFKATYGPGKAGEQLTSSLDHTKAQKELGWEPSFELKNGLKETFLWFQNKK